MNDAVADTSVMLKLLFEEQHSDMALALVEDLTSAGSRLTAPPLLRSELVKVIRRRMRRDRRPLSWALERLEAALRLPIVILDDPEVYRLALRLTEAHNLSAYDAQFVAVAQMLGCNLWTSDEAMLRAVSRRLPFVRWIGDYGGDP